MGGCEAGACLQREMPAVHGPIARTRSIALHEHLSRPREIAAGHRDPRDIDERVVQVVGVAPRSNRANAAS